MAHCPRTMAGDWSAALRGEFIDSLLKPVVRQAY